MREELTVHEIAKVAGVSIRTLQYYDEMGLLPSDGYDKNGTRTYHQTSLNKLAQILYYKTLGYSLREIKDLIHRQLFGILELAAKYLEIMELQGEDWDNSAEIIDKFLNDTEDPDKNIMLKPEVQELIDKNKKEVEFRSNVSKTVNIRSERI
ncbi:MAG: MerR family transcriptional regulator [Clostridium sp.]|jgi:DNA-binding transcriptional MerR regulator|nr:MerR family transcriptional regulator [Clostridium sp.]